MIPPIPIFTAKELVKLEFPKPKWLMYPLLTRGGDWLVGGEPDAFKSFFLMQLAIHASLGLDFLFVEIEEPLKVMYVNADDGLRLTQDRVKLLTPKGQEVNDNLLLVCQPGILFNEAGKGVVLDWVQNHKPDVVIFDPLGKFVVGGTIDDIGMQQYSTLQKAICAQDIGVISLAHFNRKAESDKDGDWLRRIGGKQAIIGDHSIITGHEKLPDDITHKNKRFTIKVGRHKILPAKEQFDTTVEVVDTGTAENPKAFLKEI